MPHYKYDSRGYMQPPNPSDEVFVVLVTFALLGALFLLAAVL